MDKKTAKFMKKGNIFEDGLTENTSTLVTKTGAKENTHSIFSIDALQTELSGGPDVYGSLFFLRSQLILKPIVERPQEWPSYF